MDNGNLLESVCWMQLIKNNFQPNYWRDKNKNEVDFIVEIGENKMVALEVKSSRNKCRFPSAFLENYKKTQAHCLYLTGDGDKDTDLFLPLI